MKMIFNDRRKFARILDWVLLRYEIIDEKAYEAGIEFCLPLLERKKDPRGTSSLNELTSAVEALNSLQNSLANEMTQAAIEKIHARLNENLNALKQEHEDIIRQPTLVNLSAGGMAFHTDHHIPEGSSLIVEMVLLPSEELITTFANVVCTVQPNGLFSVPVNELRIEFDGLEAHKRHMLHEHVSMKVDQYKARSNSE